MKKISVLLLLISVASGSCKKNTDNASTANFSITGIHDADLTLNSTASYSLPISVVPNPGSKTETVALTADNLPKGVFASFAPSSGTPPFSSRVTFRNDFSGDGGTYPVTITGNGQSGVRSYNLNVTIAYYRGWQFGDTVYRETDVIKEQGSSSRYPSIKILGGGAGELTISFGLGRSLPVTNRTYKITASSGTADDIQISMYDNPIVYGATGAGTPTGTFTFDSLGKFIFKCADVEMSNGLQKKILNCSLSE